MEVSKKINPHKRYAFSKHIAYERLNGKIIVVSVDTARWIVLENEQELSFFELLKSHTIEESLNLFAGAYENALAVVTQLEAVYDNLKVYQVITKKCTTTDVAKLCNLGDVANRKRRVFVSSEC